MPDQDQLEAERLEQEWRSEAVAALMEESGEYPWAWDEETYTRAIYFMYPADAVEKWGVRT